VAYGFLITMVISTILNLWMVEHLIGPVLIKTLVELSKPLFFVLLMIGAILLYRQLTGANTPLHTFIQMAIGGAVFAGLTLKYKMSFGEMKATLQNRPQ
jgi:lipopolysaccharide exporter